MRILVSGGSGFIGDYLLRALLQKYEKVDVICKNNHVSFPEVRMHIGDITNKEFVENCIRQVNPEIFFHLAAYKDRSIESATLLPAIQINLLGTLNLLSALSQLKQLKKIVVLGTAEEYGGNDSPFTENMREKPVTTYSLAKVFQAQLCQFFYHSYQLPTVVLRPTIVYGPKQSTDMFLPALITTLIKDEEFLMTMGEQTRDFLYISDLIRMMIRVSEVDYLNGNIINVGSGQPIQVSAIAKMVGNILDKNSLIKMGALPYRENEIMHYSVATGYANQMVGWRPEIDFYEGLTKTIQYYLELHQ